jgi:hypothetical protein
VSHILRPEELRHPVVITPSSVAQVAARRVGHRRVLKLYGQWHQRTGAVEAAPLPPDVTVLAEDGSVLTLAEGQRLYITLHTMDPTHAIYLVSR